MNIFGNVFLALTTLIVIFLLSLVYGPRPPQSGDGIVGYFFTIVLLHLMLLAGLVIVAVAVGWVGGLDWISPVKGSRLAVTAFGLLAIVLMSALAALFKYESGPIPFPFSLKVTSTIVPALFPLVLILAAAVLLNEDLRRSVPLPVVKLPLMIVFGLSGVGIIGAIGGWMAESARNTEREMEGQRKDEERWIQNHLQMIEACDPFSPQVANIYGFSSKYQDPLVREKALEKIKSNPDWQQHLIDLIEDGASMSAFEFLAHNEVDDKALLAEPVNQAALNLADWIREYIRKSSHSAHFYEDQFAYDIERMLLTIDKFKGMGTDYRPAVRAIRAALDEPNPHKNVQFKVVKELDRWLKAAGG